MLRRKIEWDSKWWRIAVLGKIVSKQGFPGASVIKNPPAKAGDMGLIPGLGIIPGEGNGNLLQYSRLENPKDRGAWRATVHKVSKSFTRHWLDGRESGWTPGVGDGQGGLACCDSWGRKESNTTERLIWSDLIWCDFIWKYYYTCKDYFLELSILTRIIWMFDGRNVIAGLRNCFQLWTPNTLHIFFKSKLTFI